MDNATASKRGAGIPLRRYTELLGTYLKPQLPRVVLLGVIVIVGIGLQLVNPQILRFFIDAAREGRTMESLMVAAAAFIGIALLTQGLSIVTAVIGNNVAWTATNELRAHLAAHCLSLRMSFHNDRTPGEMIERIDGDINSLGNFFSQFALQIVANVLLLVGVIVATFREDIRAGLAMLAFSVVSLYVLSRFRNFAVPHMRDTREASANFFGFLEEHLSGTEDIQACRGKGYVLRRFFDLTQRWLRKQVKSAMMINIMVNTNWLILAIGEAAALAVGAYLFMGDWITIGTAYLILHYTAILQRPMNALTWQFEDLQRSGATIERVQELLNNTNTIVDAGEASVEHGACTVRFDRVQFAYADAPVLPDLSFEIPAGCAVGLLGKTGAGKSTIARLLYRLYDPQEGSISINGRSIQDYSVSSLRGSIGLVTQNVHILEGSIRDNLSFFDDEITDGRIRDAISELGLEEWLDRQPEGLDTMLESGGGGLSAGEAQLIAFARILLLQDPRLVILDEASSRIDPATERLMVNSVRRLVSGRTAIIVAHRLSTVAIADRIMVLEAGRLAEYDDRESLLDDPDSKFGALMRSSLDMTGSAP